MSLTSIESQDEEICDIEDIVNENTRYGRTG